MTRKLMLSKNRSLMAVGLICTLVFAATPTLAQSDSVDFAKARRLMEKQFSGAALTDEERAYLGRAQQAFESVDWEPSESVGFSPLTDFETGQKYKGQLGGLYPNEKNVPPEQHLQAAVQAAKMIEPLDTQGNPAADGRIVMISNGMSNTTQEFSRFKRLADSDSAKSSSVVIVDCAQDGMEASMWAKEEDEAGIFGNQNPWNVQRDRLRDAGVTPEQVQVVWLKQARALPMSLGEFPAHSDQLADDLAIVVRKLKSTFPRLRLIYLSNRIYAGYARSRLNPEPYAYESGFSVRKLISQQIDGDPALNHDEANGLVKAPVLLWGPYLWADGTKGRKLDQLVWKDDDFESDGTHPSNKGRQKVAEQLLDFPKDRSVRPHLVCG